ncbi:hypothetical protein [Streptomyces sp. NPDC088261]|uniref:hypothetical protein n=1 Tax=Streptomyces sp. NPDC088261 TaxID=3365851 RepID=UPI0038213E5A
MVDDHRVDLAFGVAAHRRGGLDRPPAHHRLVLLHVVVAGIAAEVVDPIAVELTDDRQLGQYRVTAPQYGVHDRSLKGDVLCRVVRE